MAEERDRESTPDLAKIEEGWDSPRPGAVGLDTQRLQFGELSRGQLDRPVPGAFGAAAPGDAQAHRGFGGEGRSGRQADKRYERSATQPGRRPGSSRNHCARCVRTSMSDHRCLVI